MATTVHGTSSPRPPLTPTLYATKPTRFTVFIRTFLPWQFWRFIRINLKMLVIIRRSHVTHPSGKQILSAPR
ncbi:MAG: hypothetical protein ROO76_01830 [Terriglobia bacterium]|nr:hypothetical protein [Terriglobia bacterium]